MQMLTCHRDGNACLVRFRGLPFYIRQPNDLKAFGMAVRELDVRLYARMARTREYLNLAEGAGASRPAPSIEATQLGSGAQKSFGGGTGPAWVVAVEQFIKAVIRRMQMGAA